MEVTVKGGQSEPGVNCLRPLAWRLPYRLDPPGLAPGGLHARTESTLVFFLERALCCALLSLLDLPLRGELIGTVGGIHGDEPSADRQEEDVRGELQALLGRADAVLLGHGRVAEVHREQSGAGGGQGSARELVGDEGREQCTADRELCAAEDIGELIAGQLLQSRDAGGGELLEASGLARLGTELFHSRVDDVDARVGQQDTARQERHVVLLCFFSVPPARRHRHANNYIMIPILATHHRTVDDGSPYFPPRRPSLPPPHSKSAPP